MEKNNLNWKFSFWLLFLFVSVHCETPESDVDITEGRGGNYGSEPIEVQEENKINKAASDGYKDCMSEEDGQCNVDTIGTTGQATVPEVLAANDDQYANNEVEPTEGAVDENSPVLKGDEVDTAYGDQTILDGGESLEASSSDRTNYTFLEWLRYVVEPILEEFKDGIYPKLTEKLNLTSNTTSMSKENSTLNIAVVNNSTLKNTSETENVNSTDSGKKVKFQCTGRNVTDNVNASVKLITSARLLQLLNFEKNDTENVTDCLLVMFYAPWCHFCAKVAPHYNALARAFPQLDFVAVDTAQFSNLLARFGTVSVPNILVFHQSRAAVKFNQTERTFENFVTFITNSTGLEPNTTVNVTEVDYLGPIPSVPTTDPDYLLLISWVFVIFCSMCMFVKSNKGQQWINRVRILWQEHQHID